MANMPLAHRLGTHLYTNAEDERLKKEQDAFREELKIRRQRTQMDGDGNEESGNEAS